MGLKWSVFYTLPFMIGLLPNYGFKFIFTYWPRLSGSTSYIRNPSALRNQMRINVHHLSSSASNQQKTVFVVHVWTEIQESGPGISWLSVRAYLDSFRIRSVLNIRTIRRNKASSTRTWSDKSVFINVSKTFQGSIFLECDTDSVCGICNW